jgi:transcriptional regulator with XRE-family HTH domain
MQKAANRALKEPRSVATLRLRMALDAKQRAERAQRIKQLRGESPYTQAAIADRVGVTPRAYQRWEEGGGIEWEHLERLAEIHDAEVLWIHRGEGRGPSRISSIESRSSSRSFAPTWQNSESSSPEVQIKSGHGARKPAAQVARQPGNSCRRSHRDERLDQSLLVVSPDFQRPHLGRP